MQRRISDLAAVFFFINLCSCTVYNNSIISPFRNVVFTNSSIYIGGKGGIVALNREDLSEKSNSQMRFGNNWLLLYFDENKEVVQCNADNVLKLSQCRKLTENLVDEENKVVNMTVNLTHLPISTKAKVPYGDIDIVVIAATSLHVSDIKYGIVSLAAENFTLFLTGEYQKGPLNIELVDKSNIVFKSTFNYERHIYFLFQLWNNENVSSKMGKLCLYQNISKSINNYYHSYGDIKLTCRYNNTNFQQIEQGIVYYSFFIAVFTRDNVSIVCLFHWKDIATTYRDATTDFLSRNKTSSDDKYFLPFNNLSISCNQDAQNCTPQACQEVNNEDFCNTVCYHMVTTNVEQSSSPPLYIVNGLITTINVIKILEYDLMYVGTDNGQVGWVDFRINAQGKNLTAFYSFDNTKVIQIHLERESLHVVTENTVQRVNFKDCLIYKDCQSCISSANPYCGWDYSTEKCHSNGTKSAWWWTPSPVGFCIQIYNFTYYNEISDNKTHDLNFNVIFPDWVQEQATDQTQVKCKVKSENGTVNNPDRCTIGVSYLIKLTPINTGIYTFYLLYGEITLAKQSIEFSKCDDYKTCIQCTTRPFCSWCSDTFKCLSHDGGIQGVQNCLGNITSDTTTKVAWRQDPINISISVYGSEGLGLENVGSNLSCEVLHESRIIQVIVDINISHVTCLGVKLEAPDSGISNYTINLKYKEFYFGNETLVYVYMCERLLVDTNNCGECKNLLKSGYNCGWCSDKLTCSESCASRIEVTQIFPTSGPLNGGTLLTLTGKSTGDNAENICVTIDGLSCTDVKIIIPHVNFTCKTSSAANHSQDLKGIISVNGKYFEPYSNISFMYQKPMLYAFAPNKSIVSGNTTIQIYGNNIGFQGVNRYRIQFCNAALCLQCRTYENLEQNNIKCKTENTSVPNIMTRLELTIDENTTLVLNKPFYYVSDPKIVLSNDTPSVIQSGGSKITINGEGFSNVGEVSVDKVVKPCRKPNDTTVICETPTLNKTGAQTIHVNFDGLRVDINVNYVQDPSFKAFLGIYKYDKESTIQIEGTNIILGATREDYFIQVGLDGTCLITDISMKTITCYPPKNVPRTNFSDTNIVFVVVKVGRIEKYIGDLEYREEVEILPIVVGVLGSAFVIVVVVGITIILIMRKKRKKAKKQFKMELISREEMIRKASREEFADAQMTIRDIKTDLVTSRVPYCSYQTYICHQLFPNLDVGASPLLQSMNTNDNKTTTQSAMDKFDKLLTNKLFLKSLVQTLDRQNKLTMQEKANLSSLLSIALLGNMRLFYDLINCLLSDMIETASTKQQKVLFRRFESITQRLVAYWLQISMYEQLKSQSGLQLFLLYKAVQTVTEKAPIDAITGNSKNTLAEEKLLKMRVEYEPLTLQIDLNGNSDQHFPVKVLDCDTISQVKRKCCLQIYKNKPISEIPDNDELTLEWHHGKAGKHTLNDIDNINERIDGFVRLNTLKHYMVEDNSTMALMYKDHEESDDPYANSATLRSESVSSDNINLLFPESNDSETLKWHLVNLPDDVKSNIEHDIGDIFLNRLFHTKLLLTDYIDTTFEGLMDPQSLSLPVRYFLCMLDKLGKDADVDDDVLQAWKSECYATRMWAPLIGKPQIIFDVDVPNHVEPCMDILKHVFVESFTQTPHKVNKDSPPQKLLFHKDIPRYRKLINPFFMHVEPVTNQEFWSAMENLSEIQKRELKFSREATISQLYNLYVGKYKDEIISDFNEMTDSKDLGFANKLEEVIELVEDF